MKQKSTGVLDRIPLSAFQQKFKGKISSIGKQGVNEALLSHSSHAKSNQKENFLPPIGHPCRTIDNSSPAHRLLKATTTPMHNDRSLDKRSYATMPTKQSQLSRFSVSQKKFDNTTLQIERPFGELRHQFTITEPPQREFSKNPLRMTMSSDENFRQHLQLLNSFHQN